MALTVDYSVTPFLITVPKSDLNLITGTQYQLTVDAFWLLLTDYTDNEKTMAQPKLYSRIPATSSTPSITTIDLAYYAIQFENGLYSVNIVNGNTNIREAEVKNQVSVNTNNTTGFIDPTFLEASLFFEGVIIDVVNGVSGVGKDSDGSVIGTRHTPSNNINDAEVISDIRGTYDYIIRSSMVITSIDLSRGHRFVGDSPFTVLTFGASANVSGCSTFNLSIEGEMDGLNSIQDCNMLDVTNLNGFVYNSNIASVITISGFTKFMQCYTNRDGVSKIISGSNSFEMDDCHGSVIISGMTGSISQIEIYGGTVTVDSLCTGGILNIVGSPYSITDNSNGTLVIDNTGDIKTGQLQTNNSANTDNTQDIYEALYNRRKHDDIANTVTLYEADKVTPKQVWNATDDLSEINPQ